MAKTPIRRTVRIPIHTQLARLRKGIKTVKVKSAPKKVSISRDQSKTPLPLGDYKTTKGKIRFGALASGLTTARLSQEHQTEKTERALRAAYQQGRRDGHKIAARPKSSWSPTRPSPPTM